MANDRIHIVTHDNGWAVKQEGKTEVESTHSTQKEAIDVGRDLARKHKTDLVVHRQNGTFEHVYSYNENEAVTHETNGKHSNGKHTPTQRIEAEDVLSVGSRISWSAILAGAAVSVSLLIALAALGTAGGMTVSNRSSDRTLFIGAMIWSTFSILVSLFVGGFVVSRTTAGEDKTEALTYGVVLWGVLIVAAAGLTASGVNVGYQALLHRNDAASIVPLSKELGGKGGLNDEQLTRLNQAIQEAKPAIGPTAVAWWTFAGVILSMAAAVAGSLAGAGPTLVLRQIRYRRSAAPLPTRVGQLQHH